MKDGIVAVINNHTGEIYAYLKGYSHRFPNSAWLEADSIDEIINTDDFQVFVGIKYGSLELVVSNHSYSFMYERED